MSTPSFFTMLSKQQVRKNPVPLAERVLQAYGLPYAAVLAPQTGYRNQSFPVILQSGKKVNLILYKSEPGILKKIRAANAVADFSAARGFPARRTLDARIVRLKGERQIKYGALYTYLGGSTIPWDAYTQDHIKLLGKTMSDMHSTLRQFTGQNLPSAADEYLAIAARMRRYFGSAPVQQALRAKLGLGVKAAAQSGFGRLLSAAAQLPVKQPLHMDFVRSNILFDKNSYDSSLSISGILDFEKTAYGHPLFDIARTLSFLLVDCKYKTAEKIKKYFIVSGYNKRGAATLPSRATGELEQLVSLFLFYDFYKFLRHNPYEYLPQNEHFVRTKDILLQRGFVVPTTP